MSLLLCLVCLRAGAVELPLRSGSALLMEKSTGTILYTLNEHEPMEPASVTKIMTLLLVMEAIDRDQLQWDTMVTASAYATGMGGSQIYLREGEQMSVEELVKSVCVASGNDAAVALAEAVSGSMDAFVSLMNQRAQELGMQNTHFVNCTGLPAEGHLTTAYDIALMSRALILDHPELRSYTTIWMDTIRGGSFGLSNTNKLIRFYPDATGLKTGYTSSALHCISATAEREGMELIAVVLKGPTSDDRFEDAKTLLNYGFATYTLLDTTPASALPPLPVFLGTQPLVQPVLQDPEPILLEKAKTSGVEQSVTLLPSVSAPVEAGQELGTLTLLAADGSPLAELPLVAGEAVERIGFGSLLARVVRVGLLAG